MSGFDWNNEFIRVFCIEDNPGDRDLVSQYLEEARGSYEVSFASTLAEAMERFDPGSMDVVLLDLGLPDGNGLDTFYRFHAHATGMPVIVITGLDDDELGIEAIKNGAQDYLVKGRTGPEVLDRALRYALERQRLLKQLELERGEREHERESRAIHGLQGQVRVTSGLYGEKLIRELSPQVFWEMSNEYGRLLTEALESQVKKSNKDISADLRDLADRLGEFSAGPRDVVEVHKTALRVVNEKENPAKARALTVEGRFLALELMGHLASFYRRHCMGGGALGRAKGRK